MMMRRKNPTNNGNIIKPPEFKFKQFESLGGTRMHCIRCGREYWECTDFPVSPIGYCPDCRKKMRENAWKNVKKAGRYVFSKMRKK